MRKIMSLMLSVFMLFSLAVSNFNANIPFLSVNAEASENISVTAYNNGSWKDGNDFVTNVGVSVKNNGSTAISGWQVNLNVPAGSTIQNSWNGVFNLSGSTLNVTPMDYNRNIYANSEQTFGFIIKSSTELNLNAVTASSDEVLPEDESNNVSADGLEAKIIKNGAWRSNGTEYTQVTVTLNNKTSNSISDWCFKLSVPAGTTTEQKWGGVFEVVGSEVVVTPVSYNKTIYGGSNATFGFVVVTKTNYTPANYTISLNGTATPATTTTKVTTTTTETTTKASTTEATTETTTEKATQTSTEKATEATTKATTTEATTASTTEKATQTSTEKATETTTKTTTTKVTTTEKATETTTKATTTTEKATQATTEKATEATTTAPATGNGVAAHGQLKVQGTQLVDKNGNAVELRGMSTHGIAWFPDYVNEYSVKKTKEYGANLFRVAMYTEEYNGYTTSDAAKANAKALAYKGMDNAIKNDMYTIIDWHILNDNNPQTHKAEALEFFDEVSKKYANNPAVIYEICNEPHWVSWSNDIKPYAEEVIKVIRKNSPNAVVIVGTNTWSQDVDEASRDKLSFDNVMYALHFYAGTHTLDSFKGKIETALNNGCAIFVTEWGTTQASGNGGVYTNEAQKWLDYLNEKNISWANWSLANKSEDSAALNSNSNGNSWGYNDLTQSGKFVFSNFNK